MGIIRTGSWDIKPDHDEPPEVSPTTELTRISIWDGLRKRYKLSPKDIQNKSDLMKKIRKAEKLKHSEKPKGKVKSILAFVKKSDFQRLLKKDLKTLKGYTKIVKGKKIKTGGYVRTKPKVWTKGETSILKSIKKRYESVKKVRVTWGNKGTKLISKNQAIIKEFRRLVKRPRTGSSIVTKMSRL